MRPPPRSVRSAISIARATCSRCEATATATVWSSALTRSTISSGDARSMESVRGLRCSVMRGSSGGFREGVMARMIPSRALLQPGDVDFEDEREVGILRVVVLARAGLGDRPKPVVLVEDDVLDTRGHLVTR